MILLTSEHGAGSHPVAVSPCWEGACFSAVPKASPSMGRLTSDLSQVMSLDIFKTSKNTPERGKKKKTHWEVLLDV